MDNLISDTAKAKAVRTITRAELLLEDDAPMNAIIQLRQAISEIEAGMKDKPTLDRLAQATSAATTAHAG